MKNDNLRKRILAKIKAAGLEEFTASDVAVLVNIGVTRAGTNLGRMDEVYCKRKRRISRYESGNVWALKEVT